MFKRYPYWGWLLLTVVLWLAATIRFQYYKIEVKPQELSKALTTDIQTREKAIDEFTKNKSLIKNVFAGKQSAQEAKMLVSLPFYLYAYNKGQLIYWNNNEALAIEDTTIDENGKVIYSEGNTYLQRNYKTGTNDSGQTIVVMIPITIIYPFENEYIKSHFIASEQIPITSVISPDSIQGAYPINSIKKHTLFYIQIPKADTLSNQPDEVFVFIVILALITTITWLQLIARYLSKNKSFIVGCTFTVVIVAIIRVSLALIGLPFGLRNIVLFSPELYAAGNLLPSLGDLILDVSALLWIVLFILTQAPARIFVQTKVQKPYRVSLAILYSVFIIIVSVIFVKTVKSVVLDSIISFDLSHFYSIGIYAIIGLIAIGLITGLAVLLIYLLNLAINALNNKRVIKYLLIILFGLPAAFLLSAHQPYIYYVLLIWLLTFIALLDLRLLQLEKDLFSPHMIFWGVFICLSTTAWLQYFNYLKELDTRKVYARHAVHQKDESVEYQIQKTTVPDIKADPLIKDFINQPTADKRTQLNSYLDAFYLRGQLSKYQPEIYIYNTQGVALFNNDSLGYNSLLEKLNNDVPLKDSLLFYDEGTTDGHYYLCRIPIVGAQGDGHVIGFVFIDLTLNNKDYETTYPDILQPKAKEASDKDERYSVGVYVKGRLISQTGEYPFPLRRINSSQEKNEYTFQDDGPNSILWYRRSDTKTVAVVKKEGFLIESITIFSYLFGLQIVLAIVVMMYRFYIDFFSRTVNSPKIINLTLRRRIHLSMLSLVLISFLAIGSITIPFFRDRYQSYNNAHFQTVAHPIEHAIVQYIKANGGMSSTAAYDSITTTPEFKYFITNLSNAQRVDINIFNKNGELKVSSQDVIYSKSLLARIMNPVAYQQLHIMGNSLWMQKEQIGELEYISSYKPLQSSNSIYGYINIPFFSSQKELDYQISNIVVTLINLYAFIFLISSLFAVVITNNLTRTLNIIIQQFERINLQKNELLSWPYNDEIGMLVTEYNKMVKKVEENAMMLAESERESAWREMARQVAHEIKNPLTPMKLNIQYLQQSLKNDHPNVKELAGRVITALIEQIDNLSYIASEFSSFAKMPEAKAENIDLIELLRNALELYINEPDVEVHFTTPYEQVMIHADRSQMLRVITNLLQNAIEAIPEDRRGNIEVALIKEGKDIILSCKDNGTGISEEMKERLFKPYFTTKSSGTGLGLAMTKKIIEFWKGEIWFETLVDVGTTFYIRLPLLEQ